MKAAWWCRRWVSAQVLPVPMWNSSEFSGFPSPIVQVDGLTKINLPLGVNEYVFVYGALLWTGVPFRVFQGLAHRDLARILKVSEWMIEWIWCGIHIYRNKNVLVKQIKKQTKTFGQASKWLLMKLFEGQKRPSSLISLSVSLVLTWFLPSHPLWNKVVLRLSPY